MSKRSGETPRRGTRFGSLRFIRVATREENEASSRGASRGRPHWLVSCELCGRETFKLAYNVRKGITTTCGCTHRKHFLGKKRPDLAARLRIDETGAQHGSYEVVRLATADDFANQYIAGATRKDWKGACWLVRCIHCGRESFKLGGELREGVECPCVANPKKGEPHIKDRTTEHRGFLEPLRVATPEERARSKWKSLINNPGAFWICKCHNCGREDVPIPAKALQDKRVNSCGCLQRQRAKELTRRLIAAGQLFKKRQPTGPVVILRGPNEPPTVNGKAKKPLTAAQYAIVSALLGAGEFGLSKDDLDRKSGRGDARKTLVRLAESDVDWQAVIHLPGKKGGGYRIG